MVIDEKWIYAQQSVLGSVLIDDRCAGKLAFRVGEDDFVEVYRTIYVAIRDLYTTGKAVDPVTVLDRLGGGPDYYKLLQELMEITPTAANIDSYINICRECSQIYRYKQIGEELREVDSVAAAEEVLNSANRVGVGRGMDCWTNGEAGRVPAVVPPAAGFAAESGVRRFLPAGRTSQLRQVRLRSGSGGLLGCCVRLPCGLLLPRNEPRKTDEPHGRSLRPGTAGWREAQLADGKAGTGYLQHFRADQRGPDRSDLMRRQDGSRDAGLRAGSAASDRDR